MSKRGIPYFSLDVNMDTKFELIEAEFGLKGFAVIVKLFQRIYGGAGYYCEWTKEVALLFGKNVGLGGDVVSEIVSAAIRRGIFDKGLFEKYGILTSHGVQKRYFEAVSRRKQIEIENVYLLVDVAQILKNVDITQRNVNKTEENAYIPKQRKVKESKGKNNKKDSATDPQPITSTSNSPTFKELEEIIGYLNLKANTNYKATTGKTKNLVIARFNEGFTIENFKTVIDNKCAEWLCSPDMVKYLRPETLFGTKFEGYLNQQKVQNVSKSTNKFANFKQRDLDFEEIERLEQEALMERTSLERW